MRVLIFHGYLLHGTGSNIYNANLARTLREMGHEVHLLCQDRNAAELDWVDAVGSWEGESLSVEDLSHARETGSVTVYRPDIGGLLPVFVADRYEGFEVKTFPDLTDEELARYLERNVAAVRGVLDAAGEPGAALANHLIMGPAILARAGLEFAIKVHGSDLTYAIRPHPDRFLPYAREGTDAAAGILAGSSHSASILFETVPDPRLPARTRLGPPGVDVHRFRPHPPEEAIDHLEGLAERLEAERPQPGGGQDSFVRDGARVSEALRGWSEADERVLFLGKFLVSKGPDLLAAAWPLVHRERRSAGTESVRLLFAGFGAFEAGLRGLIDALASGDLDEARRVAARGRGHEGEAETPLAILSAFLADPPEGYADAAREAAGSVLVGDRLDHDEVAEVMPAADVFAMPSTWPESFGMVAVESAACGTPPVSADHSGMREVSLLLADALDPDLAPLLSFTVGPGAVEELADRISAWLKLDPERRAAAERALAKRVDELWSWEGVARTVIAASQGKLDALPHVSAEGPP